MVVSRRIANIAVVSLLCITGTTLTSCITASGLVEASIDARSDVPPGDRERLIQEAERRLWLGLLFANEAVNEPTPHDIAADPRYIEAVDAIYP